MLRVLPDVLFHVLMALTAVAAPWRMRRRGRFELLVALAVAVVALALAFLLGTGVFHRARLLAWAVFAYMPVALAACAAVLRARSRRGAVLAGVLALAVGAVGVDAFLVEPRWLETTRVRLESSKLEGTLRIAILADLQFDDFGDHEKATLEAALAEKPDVVLFAGDYVQAAQPQRGVAQRQLAAGDIQADLLVAGHTHGGQVRLPFIGPLLTFSSVPRAWAAGVTALPGGRTLIVSRGTGMERGSAPRLRFNCRPQLVMVEVVGTRARAQAGAETEL